MSRYSYLFLLIFFTTPLFSNFEKVGVIDELEGNVTINSAQMGLIPGTAIAGRLLYDGDIIHTGENGKIKLSLIGSDHHITIFGSAELQINGGEASSQLELNYGNIFTQFSNDPNTNCSIITNSSRIYQKEGELWISRNFTNEDHIFTIMGTAQVFNSITGVEMNMEMGEMIISNLDSLGDIKDFTVEMLPPEIFKQYQMNREEEKEDIVFTVMNYFSEDSLIISTFQSAEEKQRRFNFALEADVVSLEKNSYTKASLLPMYNGDRLQFGYNLAGFIGMSDSAANLNSFSTLSQILAPMIFQYQSKNGDYNLKLGHIKNLTFGYGMLLKRYTNTISYPIKQDGGMLFYFQSDAGNYTYQLFVSSIGELANKGGIVGMYGSAVINKIKPLKLGFGIVHDLNQFSSVSDSIWNGVTPRKRSISGYQVDFTYELKSDLRNDTYLFGEFTALNYPNDLRYIRSEPTNGDTTKQGFERKSSFGFLGPGIWWKIGHHRDIKIAFTYSSSLHIAPFFGETYNLERVHYVPKTILDTLENYKLYSTDDKWNEMITKNHIDSDSTAYYLPKDVNALLDPSRNVYNKIGLYAEYHYKFRSFYEYSFDISLFQETGSENPTTYYTLGMNFIIHEGLIQGISECTLYFNQYFTSEPLNTSAYNENTVFGARLGIKLLHNVSLRMYLHDVFYDIDLTDSNYKVELIRTTTAEIEFRF